MAVELHRPWGAPAEGQPEAPARALVLAGGGMRVAWQAGAIRALVESGLTFQHADGTSGGIMNLAMLLSGLSPVEMGERWSTLDVKRFSSLRSFADYVKGPWQLPALGDADGVVDHVFPHLGIDVERIHAARGMAGTFNVCNFTDKVCEAIPHTEVDRDLLVAGMSLPIFMPPVRKGDRVYTDAVWIKDANLTEAVRRGATDVWVLWCIGNTGRWGNGPLEQYVHMIEMSANGALFGELERIAARNERGDREPIRVHVVKPEFPLPLDPDFYLGRITAETLVAMGYRDGCRALETARPEGVPLDASATKMTEPNLGVRYCENLGGSLAIGAYDGHAELRLTVEVHDLDVFGADRGEAGLVGWLRWDGWPDPVLLASGTVRIASIPGGRGRDITYEATLAAGGRTYRLVGMKRLEDDRGFDAWTDATTLDVRLYEGEDVIGSGRLRMDAGDVRRSLASIEPSGAHGLVDRTDAVRRLVGLFLGSITHAYV